MMVEGINLGICIAHLKPLINTLCMKLMWTGKNS